MPSGNARTPGRSLHLMFLRVIVGRGAVASDLGAAEAGSEAISSTQLSNPSTRSSADFLTPRLSADEGPRVKVYLGAPVALRARRSSGRRHPSTGADPREAVFWNFVLQGHIIQGRMSPSRCSSLLACCLRSGFVRSLPSW